MVFKIRWRLPVGALATLAIIAIAAGVWEIASSSLPAVTPERIAVESPGAVPAIRERELKTEYRVDGIDFAGKREGNRLPGELIIDWFADGGVSFHQEVWQVESPFRAWWKFRSEDPRPQFKRGAGSALVHDVDPPRGLHADSYNYFCGNIGHSTTDEFEDCQVWGYWARYGQYLIYLELAGVHESKSSMDQVVAYFDERVVGQQK